MVKIEDWIEINKNDPVYQKMKHDRELQIIELRKKLSNDALPLRKDLQKVGLYINTAWDLVNSKGPYKEAIPILLRHLSQPYLDRNKEGMARALAVRDASFAWPTLMDEYRAAPNNSGYKMGLGAALAVTLPENEISKLVEVAEDTSNGSTRGLFLRRLRRSKSPIAQNSLVKLANDPELSAEILSWKRK